MSSLSRQCCCSGPGGICGTCEFCDCSQSGGSVTLTWSGTYLGTMTETLTQGAIDPCRDALCPPASTGGSCTLSGGLRSGQCLGVYTSSGSAVLNLVTSSPPLQAISVSGSCDSSVVTGCRTWAGWGTFGSLSFTPNATQTDYSFFSQITGEEWGPFSPCDMLRRCIYSTPNCDPTGPCCSEDVEDIGAMTLQPLGETWAQLSCSGNNSAICAIRHERNCKDNNGCTTARGNGGNVQRTFSFQGWSNQILGPGSQNFSTVGATGDWITLNASIT